MWSARAAPSEPVEAKELVAGPINHLTADDLDAFHSASLTDLARAHLEECQECRSMALLDRIILKPPRRGFTVDPDVVDARHCRGRFVSLGSQVR